VGIRLLAMLFMTVLVSGCATTSAKQPPLTQIQEQVSDLQQRMETQEKEIVDLKYEVKEMASKTEVQQVISLEESSPVAEAPGVSKSTDSAGDIIKVNASATDVQKALKSAGLYEGNLDGKIGSKTRAAIVEFQRQHNLKADGVIGQKTWGELRQYLTE